MTLFTDAELEALVDELGARADFERAARQKGISVADVCRLFVELAEKFHAERQAAQ